MTDKEKGDKILIADIKSRADNIDGGEYIETEDYIIATIGKQCLDGHLNTVMCLNDEKGQEVFKKAEEFFKNRGIEYVAWVVENQTPIFEKTLLDNGKKLKRVEGSPGMAIYDRIEKIKLDSEYRVEEIVYGKNHLDFVKITSLAFEKPMDVTEKMFSDKNTIETDSITGILIYRGKEAVGGGITIISDGIAGIYWIGVVEEERGKGIGKYIVQETTNRGFDLGANAVMLQASKLGAPVYKNLGYKEILNYKLYY